MSETLTLLCLATECKGADLVRRAHGLGARVLLITEESRKDEAWPREAIDGFYLMPDLADKRAVTNAVSYLARERRIDRIIPLDDYDVEMAASLREHLRLPGLGDSAARHVRDKLAMRQRAREAGVRVPAFTGLFNNDAVNRFLAETPAPWVLKPRAEAGAVGIRKLADAGAVWAELDKLGDKRSTFLLEAFVPGEIYHVDAITWGGEVVWSVVHKYGRPPLSVSHEGGVFTTRTLARDGAEAAELLAINDRLIPALGLQWGVSHAEFIRGAADGELYFLEVGARVGGANIAETIEAATGVNLWGEWGALEVAHARGEGYTPPPDKGAYAGIIICLAHQAHPDLSGYDDPEIVWRMGKAYHAGLIVAADNPDRTATLLDAYAQRFAQDFLAVGPRKEAGRTYGG